MSLRYDGQVAIVTGAGAGLGRIYALLLGSRGAKVVVNDPATLPSGAKAADVVVREITQQGGEASADYRSVVDGAAIVRDAFSTFGRVDIIVNNAGLLRDKAFGNMTDAEWDLVLKVHLYGTQAVTKAAWPIMRNQKFGRVVMITSQTGLYGNFGQANYAAAKSALTGFGKTLAKEGAKYNIKVNIVAPAAGSAMTLTILPEEVVKLWKADFVAPLVAYLCHKDCPASGEIFEVGGGFFSQVRYQRSAGLFLDIDQPMTIEDIQKGWGKITSFDEFTVPERDDGQERPTVKQVTDKLRAQAAQSKL